MKRIRKWFALRIYPGDFYGDYQERVRILGLAEAQLDGDRDEFMAESIRFNHKMVSQSNQCERECKLAIKRKKECNTLKRELKALNKKLAAKILVYGELEGEAADLADAAEEFLMGDNDV
jgi:septal ring factor EnvC (AmiA/AmiB activator)